MFVSSEEIKEVKQILSKNIIPDLCEVIIKYISIKPIKKLPVNIKYFLSKIKSTIDYEAYDYGVLNHNYDTNNDYLLDKCKFYYIKKYECQIRIEPGFIYDIENIFGYICIIYYSGIYYLIRYEHSSVGCGLCSDNRSKSINDLIDLLNENELEEFYKLQKENI